MTEVPFDSYISDAVEDQDGDRYLCFGEGEQRCCVPLADLHSIDKQLVQRLTRAGVPIIATHAKEALKAAAQSRTEFRKVHVARCPGWAGNIYASPDGWLIARRRPSQETILAFDPDVRFAHSSDFEAWQEAVAPFVTDQALPLFAIAFSLVGPALRFAPPDVQNPVIEIVGAKEKGKSTLAKLMSSAWGGDRNAFMGVCNDWDFSPAELDLIRSARRDGLLILDEVNRAGDTEAAKAKKVEAAIFKLADTSSRRRFGEPAVKPLRQAVLSTSNMEIRELSAMTNSVKDAMLSRILSLACDRPHGIFDNIPAGFATARAAVEAMNAAASVHYGSLAVEFITRLQAYRPQEIERVIAEGMRQAEEKGLAGLGHGARVSKTIALTYAVGCLARRLGIIPKEWGRFDRAFVSILSSNQETQGSDMSALQSIRAYVDNNCEDILNAGDEGLPLALEDFSRVPGVWIERDKVLMVSPEYLEKNLDNKPIVLRQLRAEGRLDSDSGQLTKKASRKIVSSGRAHFITIAP